MGLRQGCKPHSSSSSRVPFPPDHTQVFLFEKGAGTWGGLFLSSHRSLRSLGFFCVASFPATKIPAECPNVPSAASGGDPGARGHDGGGGARLPDAPPELLPAPRGASDSAPGLLRREEGKRQATDCDGGSLSLGVATKDAKRGTWRHDFREKSGLVLLFCVGMDGWNQGFIVVALENDLKQPSLS